MAQTLDALIAALQAAALAMGHASATRPTLDWSCGFFLAQLLLQSGYKRGRCHVGVHALQGVESVRHRVAHGPVVATGRRALGPDVGRAVSTGGSGAGGDGHRT